jgi:AhpD family alkylhydroperoxidase
MEFSYQIIKKKEKKMSGSYTDLTKDISNEIAKLRKEIPDVMGGFSQLAQAATKDGVLDKKTKELIAIALAVANHCPGCIGFHSQTLVKLQTSREELLETLGMAIYMGGGPSLMYAAEALSAFEEFSKN